jgi:Zn-dependent peptidase ImmA (M78 family)
MIDSVDNEGGSAPIEFDPRKIKYNSDGVPVLSAREIETVASELLQRYCPSVLCKPSMTPVVEIIQRLGDRTGLLFVIEDLGYKGMAKVLGKVSFRKKTMYLDTSLNRERAAAFRFTAAHEIGHWVLHRYNYKNWQFQSANETGDGLQDDESTLCRLGNRTQSDWLERQANIFAASLIMPREMFVVALKQIQKSIGIEKNIGRIYLSNTSYSRRDYTATVNQLADIFHVSKQSVRIRTRTLRLIEGEDGSEDKTNRINPFTVLRSLQN